MPLFLPAQRAQHEHVDTAPERQSGRKAQISNITAAKVCRRPCIPNTFSNSHPNAQTVADVIRTCLGPKAMLKMILDPMGGILYVALLLSLVHLLIDVQGLRMTETLFYERLKWRILQRRT